MHEVVGNLYCFKRYLKYAFFEETNVPKYTFAFDCGEWHVHVILPREKEAKET